MLFFCCFMRSQKRSLELEANQDHKRRYLCPLNRDIGRSVVEKGKLENKLLNLRKKAIKMDRQEAFPLQLWPA